jgi:hypothetical protein
MAVPSSTFILPKSYPETGTNPKLYIIVQAQSPAKARPVHKYRHTPTEAEEIR